MNLQEFILDYLAQGKAPPHRFCLIDPLLVNLFMLSDMTVFLSYMLIPLWLIVALRFLNSKPRANYVPEQMMIDSLRKFAWVFVAFIFMCGGGHLISVANLYLSQYWFQVFWNIGTATVSMGCVVAMGLTAFDVQHRIRVMVKQEALDKVERDAVARREARRHGRQLPLAKLDLNGKK